MYLAAMQWLEDTVGTIGSRCAMTYERTKDIALVLAICAFPGSVHSNPVSDLSESVVGESIDGVYYQPDSVQFSLPARYRTLTFDPKHALEISLPDLHPSEIVLKQPSRRAPFRIGTHRDIPSHYKGDLVKALEWEPSVDGFLGSVVLSSPDAVGIRVRVTAKLPANSQISVYQIDADEQYELVETLMSNDITARERSIWLPSVTGSEIGVHFLVSNLEGTQIRINQVSHVYRRSYDANTFELDGCSNHIAAACAVDRDNELESDSRTSGLIVFEDGDATYSCSGTLMNDNTEKSYIPYFLTANHCIANQSAADSVEVTWNYRTAGCKTKRLADAMYTLYGGAYLVVDDQSNDMSLIRFKRPLLRRGHWFAGSSTLTRSGKIGDTAHVFHYPIGQEQQYGTGVISSVDDVNLCDNPDENASCVLLRDTIRFSWTDGVGEPGSSGAGLVHDDRVIGVFVGGTEKCVNTTQTVTSLGRSVYTISGVLNNDTNDDHGDTNDTATHVGIYSRTHGSLDAESDVDVFRIYVTNDMELTIATLGDTDTIGRLQLKKGRVENDDGGEGSNFEIVEDLSPGIYHVEVSPYGSNTGEYTLDVNFEFSEIGNRWQDSFELPTFPFYVATALEEEDDVDWFRTYIREKGTLHLWTRGSTDTECEIRVTSSSKLKSHDDDDSGEGQNCHVQMSVVPDLYYFTVEGHDGDTGAYDVWFHLQREDDHGNTTKSATNVYSDSDNWEYRTHAHLDMEDIDYFKFDVKYDGDLSASATSNLDLTAELLDQNEKRVIFNDDSGEARNFGFNVNIEKGVYFLKVNGYFDEEAGPYTLDVNFEETF